MSDTAPQPPVPTESDIALIAAIEACRKRGREVLADWGKASVRYAGQADRNAALEAKLAEAQERLAMAVEALEPKQCRCRITSDPSRMSAAALESGARYERIHECARCAALAATASTVAQHTAEVERRGAAKELRAQGEALLSLADTLNNQTSITARWAALRLLARAAELEGA